ncbi:hypothetical protein [Nocardia sp. NBC_01009]|uniref:hypothetical protein n=1 Tax=Nocardia sp. NBC_01009 TaxID=2975996 RepID=UPI0038662630|nr:hypothetical protein OHA42_17405 [Nocardia sp. NBC_01009]
MYPPTPDQRDLWLITGRDCTSAPGPGITSVQADFLAAVHAGHGSTCHQFLGAVARRRDAWRR